jgi:hypothetical protein
MQRVKLEGEQWLDGRACELDSEQSLQWSRAPGLRPPEEEGERLRRVLFGERSEKGPLTVTLIINLSIQPCTGNRRSGVPRDGERTIPSRGLAMRLRKVTERGVGWGEAKERRIIRCVLRKAVRRGSSV